VHGCDYCSQVVAAEIRGQTSILPYVIVRDRTTGLLVCIAREHGPIQDGLKGRLYRLFNQPPFVREGYAVAVDDSPHYAVRIVRT